MQYTEAQKAMAIEIVRRNNGVLDVATLSAIRDALQTPKLPKMTIYRWLEACDRESQPGASPKKATTRKPPSVRAETQSQAAVTLDVILERAARRFIKHAMKQEVVADASAREAMTAAGIAIDKMRLLRGLPTEILGILPDVIAAFGGAERASAAFQELIEMKRAEMEAANAGNG